MTIRTGGNIIAGGFTEELLQTKANLNLDNSTAITNCITSIPQDIKLELNNGTLTLKAGSKVYVPNGVGVFDTRVFTQDISVSSLESATGRFLLTYGQAAWASEDKFDYFHVSQMNLFSGPSQPTVTSANNLWYDTTNNVIKTTSNKGSTWAVTNNTFPICIVTASSGTITSIDQIFNGFGYIGSTVFALPGVKGLIPNGRNADGSLKNTELVVSSVRTYTIPSDAYNNCAYFVITSNDNTWWADVHFGGNRPSGQAWRRWYDEDNNFWWEYVSSWSKTEALILSNFVVTGGVISNYNPKTSFHALDYSDSPMIAGWSMPSSRYIDLTLGASGTQYTAPANGWYVVGKAGSGNIEQYITIINNNNDLRIFGSTANGFGISLFIPVKKGDNVIINYTLSGATNRFKFIYAEGENV